MNSRLYNKIHEHFQHLIPRIDLGAQERLAKNEEEVVNRVYRHRRRKSFAGVVSDISRRGIKNTDGSIDVKGGVNLSRLGLYSITEIATFGIVEGDFYCSNNQLTNLIGVPKKCKSFHCVSSQLTSLKGAPIECSNFNCSNNRLTTLEYIPTECDYFNFSENILTSLIGAPEKCIVFDCSNNQLTNLKYAPSECVSFNCFNNRLTSLEGGPIKYMEIICAGNLVSQDQLLADHEERIRNMK